MQLTNTLKEARRLHQMGMGVLWVRPKSKAPVESGWTSGERHAWKYLSETYYDGLNVGVRLGEASKIGDNYLACIDVDVKDPAFKGAALEKLAEVTKGKEKDFPTVMSGGGNGSRHLYFVSAAPFKMKTIAKEKDKWEIAIYSAGRQMVLPPSVHAITEKHYQWVRPPGEFPLCDFTDVPAVSTAKTLKPLVARAPAEKEEPFIFTPSPVNIDEVKISDAMRAAIVEGTGVSDRSGYLLPACSALVRAGLTQDEVLTILTEPDFFLGACSYDHAKTTDRARAAYWLYRYTLKKVLDERNAKKIFASAPIEEPGWLTDEERAAQDEELNLTGGFHTEGPRGASIPDHDALLEHFKALKPYKAVTGSKTPSVYVFNGRNYVFISQAEVKAFAEEHFFPKPSERTRCEFLSKVLANNLVSRDFFNRAVEDKINFKNGVLDLNSWDLEVLPHSPEYNFLYALPFDFDRDADCPIFKKWVDGVMLGDEKLVAILQEFMGYIVRGGEYKHHKALWLGGEGRNGKSTFVDVLKALIGPENFSTISIKSLVGDRFSGADLEGKIANFSEETSPAELRDSGPFKNLTGDGDISAQKKYGDPFHFRNRAKLVMTYNTIPDLSDLSQGMLSRPIIVPFRKVIRDHEQDKGIKAKLAAELPGIFNFALEGWERLEAQNGFTESPLSSLALTKVREESCNVHQWVDLYIDFLEGGETFVHSRELYTAYKRQEKYNFRFPEFARRLKKHPKMQERYTRSNGKTGYKLVKILG